VALKQFLQKQQSGQNRNNEDGSISYGNLLTLSSSAAVGGRARFPWYKRMMWGSFLTFDWV
jgi:hypothetical protein